MTFGEWVEAALDPVQNRALGIRRASFVRTGAAFCDLFDPTGTPIDLAHLENAQPRLARLPLSADVVGLSIAVTGISEPDEDGARSYVFSTVCVVCGGFEMTYDKDRGDRSMVRCGACQTIFGRWGALIEKARKMGAIWLREQQDP
jgi:hypothetical protein